LILPPRLAPFQAVIVPIFKTDAEKALVLETCQRVRSALAGAGIRVKLDDREGTSPGFKFNDWEMRGVPLRVEIGPKDVAKGSVVLARRDKPGKEGKSFVPQQGLPETVQNLLAEIQQSLYDRALAFRTSHTREPKDYADFKSAVESGFASALWCGSAECEARIKEETKATTRCIPLEQDGRAGECVYCGRESTERAVFAKAY
jgi:prolyl-tRNA synthetase